MKNIICNMTMLTTLMTCAIAHADEISFDDNIITEQPFTQAEFDNASTNLANSNINELQNELKVTVSDEMLSSAANQSDKNIVNEMSTGNLRESDNQLLTKEANESSDDDDCAIWVCLPSKFPEGCAKAHKRFLKRIRRHKPPLPSFSSCIKEVKNMMIPNSGSTMTYENKNAAYIPKHRKFTCTKYAPNYNYGQYANVQGNCMEYKVEDIPESYIKGAQCIHYNNGHTDPEGCTETRSYIDIKMDGKQFGETYFY